MTDNSTDLSRLTAENKKLRDALRSCRCPDGGWNTRPPDVEPTIENCMKHNACGCVYGKILRENNVRKTRQIMATEGNLSIVYDKYGNAYGPFKSRDDITAFVARKFPREQHNMNIFQDREAGKPKGWDMAVLIDPNY